MPPRANSDQHRIHVTRSQEVQGLYGSGWTALHVACRFLMTSPEAQIRRLCEQRPASLRTKTAEGNRPLHIATQSANLGACKQLIQLGAPSGALNSNKETALRIARRQLQQPSAGEANPAHNDMKAIVELLEKNQNPLMMRVGDGQALADAQKDTRRIVRLGWYIVPLGGTAGTIGAVHSLLVIAVADAGGQNMAEFVMEKAEGDMPMNVFVSHWRAVAPNIQEAPIHFISEDQVQNRTSHEAFTVSTLYDIALSMGPYDAATCNCHHHVQRLFNSCASDECQVRRIPNQMLASMAKGLRFMGVNVAASGAGSGSAENQVGSMFGSTDGNFSLHSNSQSTSASTSSSAANRFQLDNNCSDHDHAQAMEAMKLAAWVQRPVNVLRNRTVLDVTLILLDVPRTIPVKAKAVVEVEELASGPARIEIREESTQEVLVEVTLRSDFDYDFCASAEAPPMPEWDAKHNVPVCSKCEAPFSMTRFRHHCRGCGHIFCKECIHEQTVILPFAWPRKKKTARGRRKKRKAEKMCDGCASVFAELHVSPSRPLSV